MNLINYGMVALKCKFVVNFQKFTTIFQKSVTAEVINSGLDFSSFS